MPNLSILDSSSTMDFTHPVRSTQPSVPSPDGQHLATLTATSLEVRRVSTLNVVRSVHLSSQTLSASRFICLKWSPVSKAGASDRILLADEDAVRVWDVHDEDWSATIDNGTGGLGKISNAEFGADDSELLVWSSFGARVTVWDLWNGSSIELRDPKFTTGKGSGRRRSGRSSIFAMLTRPAAQDLLTLHAPSTYQPIRSIVLPTIDAQGVKWSPDGQWIAVWDTPAMGYKVLLYTADGNLFRTYSGDYFDDELRGLGVKSLEWSPNGDFLVVAGYERTITLLSTKTFSPAIQLSHSHNIQISRGIVWQEMASLSSSARSYEPASGPVQAPVATASTAAELVTKIGVSVMGFSCDGSYIATKDDSIPTAVWVWDLSTLTCRAVLLQHSTVKKLMWHPTNPDLLLVQCIQGEPGLYMWRSATNQPSVLSLPNEARMSGKADARWIRTRLGRVPIVMFGDANSFVLAYPDGRNEAPSPDISPSLGSTDADDSLFEVLSGRQQEDETHARNGMVEDTFQFRQGIGAH